MRVLAGLALGVSLSLGACVTDEAPAAPAVEGVDDSASSAQSLTNPESGQQITLRNGEPFTLTLESNPTTGYFWTLVDGDEAIVALTDHFYKPTPAPEGLVGSGGEQTITFEGAASGQTVLTLSYQRSEEDVFEQIKLTFTVIE